ncbi:ABC transporter substrate-binding protein [Staphylococcus massiliensis]|nr:ABC transporter substrate-binding protein [Staphylococcus massiliensis]PNZ99980.1 nitrate ABC transporter substrate-binding protein [Staphylococcus massiliensis CCUG 55927]
MRRIITLLITISLILTMASCDSEGPHKSKKQTIKIGYLPVTHAANLMMTKQLNEARDSNYRVELVKFNNWPDLMDALNSGKIDGASTLIELAMKSKTKGSNIKAVALSHHEGNVIMGKDDTFPYPNQSSYNFAIPHTYSTHYLLIEKLRQEHHIAKDDVSYREMAPGEMPAALNEGRIDGYSVAEPFGALATKLKRGHLINHGHDVMPDAYCCALVLREDLINQHSSSVKSFMKDYKQAGFEMNDKDKSVAIMKKHFKQDEAVLRQSAEWTSYGDLTIRKQKYQSLSDEIRKQDLFNPPSFEHFIDTSFYKEA